MTILNKHKKEENKTYKVKIISDLVELGLGTPEISLIKTTPEQEKFNDSDRLEWLLGRYDEKIFYDYLSIKNSVHNRYELVQIENRYIKCSNPLYSLLFVRNTHFLEKNTSEKIDNYPFIQSYAKGFEEGNDYFQRVFIENLNRFLINKKMDILYNLEKRHVTFENRRKGNLSGWNSIAYTHPLNMSLDIANYFGFYTAIQTSCLDFIDMYPSTVDVNYQIPKPKYHWVMWSADVTIDRNTSKHNTPPKFEESIIEAILMKLKKYFEIEDFKQLNILLHEGQDLENKIVFKGNGNRLGHAFRELIRSELITGCRYVDLEDWITRNFMYLGNKGKATNFKKHYLNKIISSTDYQPSKPLFNVVRHQESRKYIIV